MSVSFGLILRSHIDREDKQSLKLILKSSCLLFSTEPCCLTDSWQVTRLCGPEPLTKYCVIAVFSLQLICAVILRNTPIFSVSFILTAYVVGATANQNLFLAIHEISHNLAFKAPLANRLFAVFANLPIGLPYCAAFRVSIWKVKFPKRATLIVFKPYHLTHHKSLGVDGLDTDLPTSFEALFLDSVFGKALFCTFQIFFYAIRPMMVYQLPLTLIYAFNVVAQGFFDYLLISYAGPTSLAYLILSSFLAGSLHPCAGHFIAEHYVFEKQEKRPNMANDGMTLGLVPETFSYYGSLNFLTYNVGLHNEHHDFPAIPWTRLPELHQIAKEFYADLPSHRSWIMVMWLFIWDNDVGLWCRVKRTERGRHIAG